MGGEDDLKALFRSPGFADHHPNKDRQADYQWTNMEDDDDGDETSSSMEDSSTSDMADDASSSSSASTDSNGPLYELSQLMAQLPIKRGLSKYFQGKSQSFACVSGVRNIQQFAKKERHFKRKMKAYTLQRLAISKKVSRNSMSAGLCFASCRPPLFPVQTKNFSSL
ncbi:hypothetical protein HRI_002277400 [Hibiscus trionum]|uniref:Uncharacterized protein n=1 Tax=Hibiscus trionum TaxID=183268 RepID=A0A9W7HZY3_HIBTR|nr:hypothetical protein HRI_002277400 [Hibiscus trionum]